MNTRLFKAEMMAYGDTQVSLSAAMGLSASRLNAKINEREGAAFTQREMSFLIQRYSLAPQKAVDIFFPGSYLNLNGNSE